MTDTTPSEYEPEIAAKGPEWTPKPDLRIAVYVNLPSEPERLQQAWVGSDGTVEWRDVPREIVE